METVPKSQDACSFENDGSGYVQVIGEMKTDL